MMQMRDGEAPKRKVSCYTVRPGTLALTLALWRVVCCSQSVSLLLSALLIDESLLQS
jgi:hypothetical protein